MEPAELELPLVEEERRRWSEGCRIGAAGEGGMGMGGGTPCLPFPLLIVPLPRLECTSNSLSFSFPLPFSEPTAECSELLESREEDVSTRRS